MLILYNTAVLKQDMDYMVNVNKKTEGGLAPNYFSSEKTEKSPLFKPKDWFGKEWKDVTEPETSRCHIENILKKIAAYIPHLFSSIGSSFDSLLSFISPPPESPPIPIINGSGMLAEKLIDLGANPVKTIMLNCTGNLYVSRGSCNALIIIADDNLLDLLSPNLQEDSLTLGLRSNSSIKTRNHIMYRLTLKSDPNHLILSGTGNIRIKTLDIPKFTCEINGTGDVTVGNGSIDHQVIKVSGTGDYKGSDVKANHSYVAISGSGDVKIKTTHNLFVKIIGSGDCFEYGNPKIAKHLLGSGSVQLM